MYIALAFLQFDNITLIGSAFYTRRVLNIHFRSALRMGTSKFCCRVSALAKGASSKVSAGK